MPLYIAHSTSDKKHTSQIYSIHEIDYMVTKYLEVIKLASVFQHGGELQDKLKWGDSTVVEGFKFLLEEYERNNK
jgi:hypothetical protein